jgi:environmental stress-induced protein Ves
MGIKIFAEASRTTINWASGTSTEIFIHPGNAKFSERNFQFRISTATVEAEESNFTFFEGITRHLMILKGELVLVHEDRYEKKMKPFDQDTFSGEWKTRSRGKVTDFNLMLKAGATGSLNHRKLSQGSATDFNRKGTHYFLYFAAGSASVRDVSVNAGDLVQADDSENISVRAKQNCDVIEIEVTLN